jgi:hypothetical protein
MRNDAELVAHLKTLVKREASLDFEIIEALREVHKRKLFLSHGTSSFHELCASRRAPHDETETTETPHDR